MEDAKSSTVPVDTGNKLSKEMCPRSNEEREEMRQTIQRASRITTVCC